MKVMATKDFTVGVDKIPCIKKGAIREVDVASDGTFTTTTDKGEFFGWCAIDRGWVPVCDHKWIEAEGEPPYDVCFYCGEVRE